MRRVGNESKYWAYPSKRRQDRYQARDYRNCCYDYLHQLDDASGPVPCETQVADVIHNCDRCLRNLEESRSVPLLSSAEEAASYQVGGISLHRGGDVTIEVRKQRRICMT